jgi:hypothetical protein
VRVGCGHGVGLVRNGRHAQGAVTPLNYRGFGVLVYGAPTSSAFMFAAASSSPAMKFATS